MAKKLNSSKYDEKWVSYHFNPQESPFLYCYMFFFEILPAFACISVRRQSPLKYLFSINGYI